LSELLKARAISNEGTDVHARLRDELILPIMDRINKVTGQENDPDYFAYLLEYLCITDL
jgi:hypothetical protein